MDINILYFLMRLYSLCEDFESSKADFSSLYNEMLSRTDGDIVSKIPSDIKKSAEALCENYSSEGLLSLLKTLEPYKTQCEALLPDLSEANEKFLAVLKAEFCENGYFLKDSIFRKIKGNHIFILECELAAAFIADEVGRVTKIRVAPIVRVADARVNKARDGKVTLKKSGILDDDATVTDVKLYEPKSFYRILRHLEFAEYEVGEKTEVCESDIERIAKSALVASAVCENRAIPSYYKALCKNDIPRPLALKASVTSGFILFVLLSALLGIALGLVVLAIMGLKKVWGLYSVPYYYLFTALVSLIYSLFVYKKIRRGRF